MQYLEDLKQEQRDDLDNWHFNHINRIHHESWERKARIMRHRRKKEMRHLDREMHKKLKRESHEIYKV